MRKGSKIWHQTIGQKVIALGFPVNIMQITRMRAVTAQQLGLLGALKVYLTETQNLLNVSLLRYLASL